MAQRDYIVMTLTTDSMRNASKFEGLYVREDLERNNQLISFFVCEAKTSYAALVIVPK